jgi:hypothetical protein
MRWEGWPPPDEEGERTRRQNKNTITQKSNRSQKRGWRRR